MPTNGGRAMQRVMHAHNEPLFSSAKKPDGPHKHGTRAKPDTEDRHILDASLSLLVTGVRTHWSLWGLGVTQEAQGWEDGDGLYFDLGGGKRCVSSALKAAFYRM